MAATVSSSTIHKAGAWALDSEQNEAQLMAQPNLPSPPSSDFPSLASSITTKPKKKNKAQTLSLAQFNTFSSSKDDLIVLPTGPRERAVDEVDKARLGGGFRNYGGGDRDRSRVNDNNRKERVESGPSRADEVDDWSKSKKFNSFGPGNGPERRDRSGFFNSSRADEVDNWAVNKKDFSSNSNGEPLRRERRMGFESYSNGSGLGSGSDSDNWLKKKNESSGINVSNGVGSGSGLNGRPKLNLQPRTLPVVRSENVSVSEGKTKGLNPFGEARPREEVLKEKGKDWKEIDEKLEAVKLKEEKSEGFGGRRRGFGSGSGSGDEKSVRSWRKPESNDVVASPTGSSSDASENKANTAESTEKVAEEN